METTDRELLLEPAQLGRVRSDQALYYFPQQAFPQEEVLRWQEYNSFQSQVSQGVGQSLTSKKPMMVHAVTGAE